MSLKKIIKMYERSSVSVCGMKGRGKDMLTANVVARRKKPYISNIDYGGNFIPFDYKDIALGSTYKDLISGNVKPYIFPYNDGTDIYLSDCGIYFPSQYCNELNRDFKDLPTFIALSRQLGLCSVNTNCQNLNRVWDKIREMSDAYIYCNWCKVLFGKLVIQKVTIYDKYESALNRVKPNRIKIYPWDIANYDVRTRKQMYIDTFANNHGDVKSKLLIYINKSNYDTRHFKGVFSNEKNIA